MKSLFLLSFFIPIFSISQNNFWTDDFGSGCNQALGVGAYLSPHGFWTVTNTGTNAGSANLWFVSAMENGNAAGECGTGCGNDRTLHLGNTYIDAVFSDIPADNGAAYYEGIAGFCGFIPCGATDKRVESPGIDCSAYSNITLSFVYIEGGNVIDNATLWYYNGSAWSQLADMAKTFSSTCSPQGIWTNYNTVLPASANNNSNIKIGFRWINNEDGDATDPSFAVDDVALSVAEESDTESPVVSCPSDQAGILNENCEVSLPDFTVLVTATDAIDLAPSITQQPAAGTLVNSTTIVTITATDASGNASTCEFLYTVSDFTAPTIDCPENVVESAPFGTLELYFDIPLPEVADNCGVVAFENDFNNLENASGNYPGGTTEVIYTAVDGWGNTSLCTFSVTLNIDDCCFGDLNCDGYVNVSDMLLMMQAFGTSGAGPADLSNDGVTNVADLLFFNTVFGTTCE